MKRELNTGVTYPTPFAAVFGVVLISLAAITRFGEVLEGFASTPLFFASGFMMIQISLLLLLLKAKGVSANPIINLVGATLGFCFGVYISAVVAKFFAFGGSLWAGLLCALFSFLLVGVTELAYKENVRRYFNKNLGSRIPQVLDAKLNRVAGHLLFITMCLLALVYIVGWYVADGV